MGELKPATHISDAGNGNEIIHSLLLGGSTRGQDGEKPIPCRVSLPQVSQAAGPPCALDVSGLPDSLCVP